jgi:thymidine kinase
MPEIHRVAAILVQLPGKGMRTVVYTAEIDRFGAGKVSSRIGLSPAKLFNPQTDLFEDIRAEHASQPIHCVLVDESQFLTREQVHALSEVVDELDIPVLCYGLRGFPRRAICREPVFARLVG